MSDLLDRYKAMGEKIVFPLLLVVSVVSFAILMVMVMVNTPEQNKRLIEEYNHGYLENHQKTHTMIQDHNEKCLEAHRKTHEELKRLEKKIDKLEK